MTSTRGHLASLIITLWVFGIRIAAAQTQNEGPASSRIAPAGEMAVHEVNPGKLALVLEAPGRLEAEASADLYSLLEGQATIRSLVPEGHAVKKGDLVCELDSSFLRDQLTNQVIAEQRSGAAYLNAKLSREVAEIAVSEYVDGIFKQELYALKSEIAGSEAAIQRAQDRLDRTQRASQKMSEVAKNAPKTPADVAAELDIVDRLEDAEQSLQKERKTLELANGKLNVLEKYTREKTTKTLKLEVERKRTEELSKKDAWLLEKNRVDRLNRQIAASRIVAPRDGAIVYANNPTRFRGNGRTQIEEGATVRLRQRIASVIDLAGPFLISAKVPESKVDQIAPGLRAAVSVDSFPQSNLHGTVVSVAPLPDPHAMAAWDPIVYTVKLRIDERLPGLRPGMTGRAEIWISELNNALTLPRESVIRLEGKDQVAILRSDGGFEWREVTLGASNDAMIEILSGLKKGDSVAIKPVALLSDAQKQRIASSPTAPAGSNRGRSAFGRRPGER